MSSPIARNRLIRSEYVVAAAQAVLDAVRAAPPKVGTPQNLDVMHWNEGIVLCITPDQILEHGVKWEFIVPGSTEELSKDETTRVFLSFLLWKYGNILEINQTRILEMEGQFESQGGSNADQVSLNNARERRPHLLRFKEIISEAPQFAEYLTRKTPNAA